MMAELVLILSLDQMFKMFYFHGVKMVSDAFRCCTLDLDGLAVEDSGGIQSH